MLLGRPDGSIPDTQPPGPEAPEAYVEATTQQPPSVRRLPGVLFYGNANRPIFHNLMMRWMPLWPSHQCERAVRTAVIGEGEVPLRDKRFRPNQGIDTISAVEICVTRSP